MTERTGADAADSSSERPLDFIRARVRADLEAGKNDGRLVTRFPPEPNGYLHIGHAKSICLNFGLAEEHPGARCHLRFDDTNPAKEETRYVDAIKEDVRWLGYDWGEHLYFASDYFERLYQFAVDMIRAGRAYVCSLSEDEIRQYRGTVRTPGTPSPYRDRSVEENLKLFEQMRAGEFDDGAHVLRAKGDLSASNMKLRDPLIYRIRKAAHHRTGRTWSIYPMYDFAHCLSDALERVTHSFCTLEFENNRALYDWFLEQVGTEDRPKQIEFARLNLSHTVMSKRKLLELVTSGVVDGWDDPRMPTIAGLRRRGVTPEAIRAFCDKVGVARANSIADLSLFEHCIRDDLNHRVGRAMAVVRPLRVVIENYPEGQTEYFDAPNLPDAPEKMGTRKVAFSRELFIEATDYMDDPPKKYFRLAIGREVRLRWAYLVTCTGVERDADGNPVTLLCRYDPESKGGQPADGRKVRGTIHWVSAAAAVDAELRLYEHLFTERDMDGVDDPASHLNPGSKEVRLGCKVEPHLAEQTPGYRVQFERQGFFAVDSDSTPERPVYNRTVGLRDSWAKIAKGKKT